MEKPTFNDFPMLSPLTVQKYERYLPTAFDESMTLLEKSNKIIEFLNHVQRLLNDFSNDWENFANYIIDYHAEFVDRWDDFVSKVYGGVLIWLSPVQTFDLIQTTYPNAVEGNAVMVRDTGKVYRKTNGSWVVIQDLDPTAFNELDNRVSKQIKNITIDVESFGAKGDGVTDDTLAFQNAIDSLTKGGTVTCSSGLTYIVRKISARSNVALNLNGSTLKQKSNVPIYTNTIDIGDSGLVKNFKVYNGKLDGNKENQTVEFYRYGIYTLNCDGVYMDDLEIVNYTGEGVFIGYTGFYSKNVFINRMKLGGNLRNDIAITNAENVFVDDLTVDSIAYDSASVDLELQDATDKIINVHFKNLFVKSNIQQAKIVKNGFAGVLKNISIDNAVFTGTKSLGIEDADFVTLNKVYAEQGIEIMGCREVVIDNLKIKNATKNGLYVYKNAINGNKTNNITLSNIDIENSNGYGLLLQDVENALLNTIQTFNNKSSGLGVLYNNKNILINNLVSTDRRTTGKTQPYGIEFQGVNQNIQVVGGSLKGNLTGEFLNLPSNINLITQSSYKFVSPSGEGSHSLDYDNNNTLTWGAFFGARRYGFTGKYDVSVDVVPNGTLFEDTNMATLKYKNQSGSTQLVSNRRVASAPTSGVWETGDIVYANNPVSGGYIGWVCTQKGTYNPNPWQANTTYAVGNIRNTATAVYRCVGAGTTSSTPPSHTSGSAVDGTVIWEFVDTLLIFKGFGLIQ